MGVFGVDEVNCTIRFRKFLIEFSPVFKKLCSSVHISAMNTVHQNLLTQYELTIDHAYPMQRGSEKVTSGGDDFYRILCRVELIEICQKEWIATTLQKVPS